MRRCNSFSKTNMSSDKNSKMTFSSLRLLMTSAALKILKFQNTCVVNFLWKYHVKHTHCWSTKWISTSFTWSFTSWTSTSSLRSVASKISCLKKIKFLVYWWLTLKTVDWARSKKNWILEESRSSTLKAGRKQPQSRKANQILNKLLLRKKRIWIWFLLKSPCHSWIKNWLKKSKLNSRSKLSFLGMPCRASVLLDCFTVTGKSTLRAWVTLVSSWLVVSRTQLWRYFGWMKLKWKNMLGLVRMTVVAILAPKEWKSNCMQMYWMGKEHLSRKQDRTSC